MSDQEKWAEGLLTDRTDNNLETCYCIGPQVVSVEKQLWCPCRLRAVNAFRASHSTPYVDPVEEEDGVEQLMEVGDG